MQAGHMKKQMAPLSEQNGSVRTYGLRDWERCDDIGSTIPNHDLDARQSLATAAYAGLASLIPNTSPHIDNKLTNARATWIK